MSWIPGGSAGRDPECRTAPRPAAAAQAFTFGRLHERERQGQEGSPPAPPAGAVSQRLDKACFDEPVEKLRWWQQPRNAVTVSGSSNADIEAFWAQAKGEPGAVEALVNVEARRTNKAQGISSTVKASLCDVASEDGAGLAGAQSCYKADLLAGHVRVGKRGVCQSAEAMQAYAESRQQAERNKQVGKSTNMRLGIF